ncbi:hypothetical protein L7F22_008400 [Adiantum nelumboides]|nr:hypothetical protein [Adiantum nelumboides]
MSTFAHIPTHTAAFVDTDRKREARQPPRRLYLQDLSGSLSSDTLSTLLKDCGKAKALDDGKLLHSHICKFLGVHNTFLGNCLVEMYGECGDLLDAASTFNLISEFNLYSWNILINAYAKNNYGIEALQAYHVMQNSGFSPTPHTFVCVLNGFDLSVTLTDVWKIHSSIIESGYIGQVIVCTALINVYGKIRSFLHADIVFKHIPAKDVVAWNAMLAACNKSGNFQDAFRLFQQMRHEGFEPSHATFTCMLETCATLGSLHDGKEMHNLAHHRGFLQNQIVANALLNMYGKCGSLEDARNVFVQMPQRDVFSWSSMIGACVRNGSAKEGLELFNQMNGGDVEPNSVTYVCAIEACASMRLINEAKRIHALVAKSKFARDLAVLSALITMYGKCRSPHDAKCVFDQVNEPSVSTWNAMISMYLQSGSHEDALDLFTKMQHLNYKPNAITLVCALDACACLANLQEGQKINDLVAESIYKDDVMVNTALIRMFGNCGDVKNAEVIFQRATEKDVILWSSMVAACAHTGCDEKALDLFYQMQLRNVIPDSGVYVCALNACSNLSCIKEGLQFHIDVVKLGYEDELQVATALVDMYGKCGSLDSAREVFTSFAQRDFIMWNTMVSACAQNSSGEEAIATFHEMLKAGINPDGITFISVLSACNHMGDVDEGKRVFALMKDYKIQHTAEHCSYMVDLLSRAGHIDDAETLIDALPSENCLKLWLLLLGACCSHGDPEQARRIAGRALQIDPDNPTPYVLLSNMNSASKALPAVTSPGDHG